MVSADSPDSKQTTSLSGRSSGEKSLSNWEGEIHIPRTVGGWARHTPPPPRKGGGGGWSQPQPPPPKHLIEPSTIPSSPGHVCCRVSCMADEVGGCMLHLSTSWGSTAACTCGKEENGVCADQWEFHANIELYNIMFTLKPWGEMGSGNWPNGPQSKKKPQMTKQKIAQSPSAWGGYHGGDSFWCKSRGKNVYKMDKMDIPIYTTPRNLNRCVQLKPGKNEPPFKSNERVPPSSTHTGVRMPCWDHTIMWERGLTAPDWRKKKDSSPLGVSELVQPWNKLTIY